MSTAVPVIVSPVVTIETRPHWSATRLKSLMLCPRQYKFAYIDLIPSVPTAPLVFGRVLHQALLFVHQRQMDEGCLPPVSETLLRFDDLWLQSLDEERPFFRTGAATPDEHTRIGHELLRSYLRCVEESAPPMAAELSFEITIGDDKLKGVIDRIDETAEGLVIVDFKSGVRKLTPQEVERDLQLTVYAFAAGQLYGKSVARVAQYYLRDGTYMPSLRGPDDFTWLTEEVLPYAQRVFDSEQYPPRYGYHCNWCDYREICRLQKAEQRAQEAIQEYPNGGEETWHSPQN